MSYVDKHALLQMPGAMVQAGTAGKQVPTPKTDFMASIGQGAAAGGTGQYNGVGGSGDPTIGYPVGTGLAKPIGRAGSFGTPYQSGKAPVNYDVAQTNEEY